jgi:hypothetical protein
MSKPGATPADVERFLRGLPISTPEDVNTTSTVLQHVLDMRNYAFEATGVNMMPVVGLAFSVPQLIQQMQQGQYLDAAQTLISVGGNAAATFSVLVAAATEMGAITSATAAISQAGVITGMIGEAAGPAALGLATLVAAVTIPIAVNENQWKIFYIADVSGILMSWLFSRRDLSPHANLMQRARTGGYSRRTDISDSCRMAHRRAHDCWVRNFQNSQSNRRAVRQAANNQWDTYWRQLAGTLDRSLAPFPSGIGLSFVQSLIQDTQRRVRSDARQVEEQRRRTAARVAAGGVWVTTDDGLELFLPDD